MMEKKKFVRQKYVTPSKYLTIRMRRRRRRIHRTPKRFRMTTLKETSADWELPLELQNFVYGSRLTEKEMEKFVAIPLPPSNIYQSVRLDPSMQSYVEKKGSMKTLTIDEE